MTAWRGLRSHVFASTRRSTAFVMRGPVPRIHALPVLSVCRRRSTIGGNTPVILRCEREALASKDDPEVWSSPFEARLTAGTSG